MAGWPDMYEEVGCLKALQKIVEPIAQPKELANGAKCGCPTEMVLYCMCLKTILWNETSVQFTYNLHLKRKHISITTTGP